MNGVEIEEERSSLYAVHSNNADITHLLELNQILNKDETIEKKKKNILFIDLKML